MEPFGGIWMLSCLDDVVLELSKDYVGHPIPASSSLTHPLQLGCERRMPPRATNCKYHMPIVIVCGRGKTVGDPRDGFWVAAVRPNSVELM